MIPRIAGQDITQSVRLLIGDNEPANYEFTDDELGILLDFAIVYYQRLKPYILETDITIVADQSDYVAPVNMVRPIFVEYRTVAGLSTESALVYFNTVYGTTELIPFRGWSDETINRMRDEWRIRFDAIGAGQSEFNNYLTSYSSVRFIRLFPTPKNGGDTFALRYEAFHPQQNNDYFTIPPEHVTHVQKLLLAEVFDQRATKMSATATQVSTGSTVMKFDKAIDALLNRANFLRNEVRDALFIPIGRFG